MDHPSSLSIEQIPAADWDNTPESVKMLVTSLLNAQSFSKGETSQSDHRLLQFLEATPIGIAVHDAAGKLVYVNQVGRSLWGGDRWLDRSLSELSNSLHLYHGSRQIVYPLEDLPVSRALQGETVWVDDLEIHRPDRIIPLDMWGTPIFDDQGQVVYAIVAFQDISDRKRRELERQVIENTRQTRDRLYRQVIQAQTDLILRSLPDTTITFANEALCSALGLPLEDVLGLRWSDFVPPDDIAVIHQKIAALTPEHPTFENMNPDRRSDHQIGWTQWISLGIFDDGQLVEIQSVGRDVTVIQKQLNREQSMNRVLQAIRSTVDLNSIFTLATQETAQLLDCSWCGVIQYRAEQELWQPLADYGSHPDQPPAWTADKISSYAPWSDRLQRLEVVQVDDMNPDTTLFPSGAWLLIPLVVDDCLWGSFVLYTDQQPFTWHPEQRDLAQAMADQLEIAIQQATLSQQVQDELAERCRAEAALRESEGRFQTMADNVPGVIYGYRICPDGSDHYAYISSGFRELYGIDPDQALQNPRIISTMTHPDDASMLQESFILSEQTLQTWECQYRIITADGQLKWLQGIARPTGHANGDISWDGLIIDISDRKRGEAEQQYAEAALRDSEARYRLLAENTNDLVCLHELNGTYIYVSPSCESLLGYQYNDMVGQEPSTFLHPEDCDRVYQESRAVAISGKSTPITYRMRHRAGHYIWFETLTRPILDAAGTIIQLQTTSRDVTERIQVQERLRYDALHDSLTGLPNRNWLMERLALSIHQARRLDHYQYAVLFLDLDRFKVVNDSLGHLAGDQLLIAIAQRLQSIVRATDLVVRLGGDEFVLLLESVEGIQEVVHATERIFSELRSPLTIEGRDVYVTSSIGIVLGNKVYQQASHLLRDADIAMYRAKMNGKARYEIFDADMHRQAMQRLHLEQDLRQAIDRQEFVLYYQPIFTLEDGRLTGFEALIRWQHPSQGLKSPGDFIAVAEEIGLITLIDDWALHQACHQLALWQAKFPAMEHMKVSVNLSVQDLKQLDLLDKIDRILATTHLAGHCLTLEITESMLIDDVEAMIDILRSIKERNIQISIDDFGTGYSSLNYLHRLPVDNLKVDRSFVDAMQNGQRNYQIVETIVALSHQLGLEAIAEGIETQEQLQQLQHLGYQFGQGYLASRPLPDDDAERLLAKHQRTLL